MWEARGTGHLPYIKEGLIEGYPLANDNIFYLNNPSHQGSPWKNTHMWQNPGITITLELGVSLGRVGVWGGQIDYVNTISLRVQGGTFSSRTSRKRKPTVFMICICWIRTYHIISIGSLRRSFREGSVFRIFSISVIIFLFLSIHLMTCWE